jgi:hypothetical protein
MRPLAALAGRELLDIWEVGASQPLAQRALWLLSAAQPDTSYEALAQLPIGARDAQLLALRERLFGTQLVGVATCPRCGERLQLTLNTPDLNLSAGVAPDPLPLTVDRYSIRYRLPNSTDLLALAGCEDAEAGRQLLLGRCIQDVQGDDVTQTVEALPDDGVAAVIAHMAQADPQADVQFDLNCPACQHHWLAAFDIMAFLWHEIDGWAQRILREVHVLASAYGWSEADILSMSATRRQLYLELIGGT